jgi:hypothetical protein
MTEPTRSERFWRFLGTPFRAIVALTGRQIRSLFSIAMLSGIIALSVENWVMMFLAYDAGRGEVLNGWFKLIIERTRYNSGLQAWFAVILALIVFGADYFRAKLGEKEISFGKGPPPVDRQEPANQPLPPVKPDEEIV